MYIRSLHQFHFSTCAHPFAPLLGPDQIHPLQLINWLQTAERFRLSYELLIKRSVHLLTQGSTNTALRRDLLRRTNQQLGLMQQHIQRQAAESDEPQQRIEPHAHTMDLAYLSHQANALVRHINRCIG